MRVALYNRVSTDDKGQDAENYLIEMRDYCTAQDWSIIKEYVDHESGLKGRRERGAFDALFKDAAQRKFDVVLFWMLDRFSREGIRKTLHYLQLLDSYGVRFKSLKEEYLTTDNELVSHICIAYMSYFANLESKKISERTIVGMARARDKGKQIGRPSKRTEHEAEVMRLYAAGESKSAIARTLGLSRETVRTYLR